MPRHLTLARPTVQLHQERTMAIPITWVLVILFAGLLLAAVLIDPGVTVDGGAGQVMQALGTGGTV